MGKASRWFRGLFTAKKPTSYPSPADHPNPPQEETRNKKWGFVKSFREKDKPVPALDREMDENKRAIAVAAATAAVAEAAVAAAQAAAVVVRLTSSGRVFGRKREDAAAVRIQAAFRAYLARRALRALKSLVKLQALVRGNIVRKQATETLRCMQALVRVQARARACRSLRCYRNGSNLGSHHHPHSPSPEKLEQHKRSNACKPERSSILKSNGNSELRWLGHWMVDRYWDDENAKILEIDTGKSNKYTHSSSNPFGHSFTTVPDSPSKDSTIPQYSISSPSSVNMEVESLSPLRFPIVDGCEYADSPQFFSASSTRRGRLTPAKSECSMSMFSGYSDCPSYMANTESSWAKFRSQSAPKQRPEFNKSVSTKRMPGSVQKTFAAYSVHRQGLSRFREVG